MKIRPIISSTLCMLMLVAGSVGCAPKRVDPTLSRAPQQPNPDGARALLRSGGDTADWGLALSGGAAAQTDEARFRLVVVLPGNDAMSGQGTFIDDADIGRDGDVRTFSSVQAFTAPPTCVGRLP